MKEYNVGKLKSDIIHVNVPGSKSITNRALLIAALANGISILKGTLTSDDSEHFMECLIKLGFNVINDNNVITIQGNNGIIPNKKADINVGSAGTAARFITAMLAFSDGEYYVNASQQMQKRPMAELIKALEGLGAVFEYSNEEYSLPFRVFGMFNPDIDSNRNFNTDNKAFTDNEMPADYRTELNIDKSSQFLSALLMTAPMLKGNLRITLTGTRKALSYVGITIKMMNDFGIDCEQISDNEYCVISCNSISYRAREYTCEPDVSAACYYYAMAAVTGSRAVVDNVYRSSMQGDIRFLDILSHMGCEVYDTPDGVAVRGTGTLKGIDVDMSDCSDQTMTLAAIAPYADSPVTIRGVGHIRKQESDRIAAIADALGRMGIRYEEYPDGIKIYPGIPIPAHINTFDDHRMAMAFAVTGLVADGIVIDNPDCCSKTFPEYFEILDTLT